MNLEKEISAINFKRLSEVYAMEWDARDEDVAIQQKLVKEVQDKVQSLSERFQQQLATKSNSNYPRHVGPTNRSKKTRNYVNNDNNLDRENHEDENKKEETATGNHRQPHNRSKNHDTNIIKCTDSNRKFINFRKLRTLHVSKGY